MLRWFPFFYFSEVSVGGTVPLVLSFGVLFNLVRRIYSQNQVSSTYLGTGT